MITLKTARPIGVLAALGAAMMLFATKNAAATTVVPLTTDDLAHISDAIVVGHVEAVSMRSEPLAPGRTSLVVRTHTTVVVDEVWKGDVRNGDELDVLEFGGVQGTHVVEMEGAPGYKVGEKVVLFLAPDRDFPHSWLTVGLFLGKYTVLPTAGGDRVARISWPMTTRGLKIDLARDIPAHKVATGTALSSLRATVKDVVTADAKAGIDGKMLPKYDGLGVR